jgi:hypothetical protein
VQFARRLVLSLYTSFVTVYTIVYSHNSQAQVTFDSGMMLETHGSAPVVFCGVLD